MRRVLPLVLAIALGSPAAAQEADVLGWQETRWGMTVDQAAAALGGEARFPKEPTVRGRPGDKLTCSIEVPGISVGAHQFVAYLCFRDNSLALVVLSEPESTATSFDALQRGLVEKYGAPTLSERTPGRKLLWTFKSTTVSLSEYAFPPQRGKRLIIVSVGYEPVRPSKL